jgi:predicted dehydrogenase
MIFTIVLNKSKEEARMKIGIIGTENSHALHFAKTINLSKNIDGTKLYPDMEVVALWSSVKKPYKLN